MAAERTFIGRARLVDDWGKGLASVQQSAAKLGQVVDKALGSAERRQTKLIKNDAADLRKEYEKIARSVNPLANATRRYEQQLGKLRQAKRENIITDREFSQTLAGLNRRLKESEDRASGARRRYTDLGASLRSVAGLAAGLTGGVSVAFITREAVGVAADFQKQMAAVQAVTGATGKQFDALKKQARDLGASTAFSAREAATAMQNLGQAGFTTNEIMASIGGNLDLAAAGQLELGRAAEISANVLRGFNLQASESGRVSDVLAKAAVTSNQTVSDLGEAMKFAAPTALAFGISLEETTASIAKLADTGLKGGLGGRGFQSLVTNLVKEQDDIEKIIDKFDLQTDGLTAVIRRIAEAGLTDQQAIKIFKAENIDVYTSLKTAALDAAKGTDAYTESLRNAAGEAKRVAETKFSGLFRAFDELKGAQEDLFIEAGDAGGLAAIETVVTSLTDALRSPEALDAAKSIGQAVNETITGIVRNWGLVVEATKAATAAAIVYGTASLAAAGAKAGAALSAKVAQTIALVQAERSAAATAIAAAQAEAAQTAARLADAKAAQTQLSTSLSLATAQRAEAASRLQLAQGITAATGIRAAETAANANLAASTRAVIATRRALVVADAEVAAASAAAATATTGLSGAQAAQARVFAGTATAATGLAGAYARLAIAAKGAGTALAFSSVGGVGGLARGVAGVSVGLGRAAAAATALAAVNLGRLVGQVTGLSAVAAVIGAPLTVAITAFGALTAAVVVYRKDISQALVGTRDIGVALEATKAALNDNLAPVRALGRELAAFGAKTATIASKAADIAAFASPAVALVKALDLPERIVANWSDIAEKLGFVAKTAALLNPGALAVSLTAPRLNNFREDVARRAEGISNLKAQEGLPTVNFNPFPRETEAAIDSLTGKLGEFRVVSVEAAEAGKKAFAEAGKAAADASDEAEKFAEKVATQTASLAKQIETLKTLNDAKAAGKSDAEIELIEKQLELADRYPELAKANRELFNQEAKRLQQEELRAKILKDSAEEAKKDAERLKDIQQQSLEKLARSRDDLARGFATAFSDVWRSFREEGVSAIDVIKRHLLDAFDNTLGQAFEDAFRPIAEKILTGRSPEVNLAGQIFTEAALDARAKGLSGRADPFGQTFGGGPAIGITTRDLQATLNGQSNLIGTLAKAFTDTTQKFAKIGEGLGKQIGQIFGDGAGKLLGKAGAGAGAGFAGFQFGTGAADLFNGRQGETGSKIGGTVGGAIGFAVAGPIGAAIGAAAGGFFGDILGGLFGRKTGTATVSLASGAFSDVKQSKKDSRNELRDAIGQGAFEAVSAIKDLLGGALSSTLGLQIAVGKKSASATLVDSATGRTLGKTSLDKNDIDSAVKSALKLVIQSGFKGVDETLGKVAAALASTALPAQTVIDSLGSIKSALEFGEDPPSVFAEALKNVTKVFGEAIDAARGLGSAVSDLVDVQLEALGKIAASFDKDVDRRLREIKAPESQQALDLLDEQLKRIADANAINDALLKATQARSAAPQGGSNIGAAGAGGDFFRNIQSRFGAFEGGLYSVETALGAATDATASLADAANDNSEAAARLAKVNALNSAEWEQFIRQAGATPAALNAVAAALASIGDRAEELGLDLAALDAQFAEVKAGLATAFDKDVEDQRLALVAPQQSKALALIEQQTARFDAARAVSAGAADEQARLTRVIALNTAEWQEFIKQASSTPEALNDAAAAIERFAAEAAALGADPALLNRQVADARAQLAGDFNTDVAERLLAVANPTLAQFNSLLRDQQTRVQTAQALGANVSGAERLNALERQKFFEGLSDDQKLELGDFLGQIEDLSGRWAVTLQEFIGSAETASASLGDVVEKYDEAASDWEQINKGLGATLEDLKVQFAPGNLSDQLRAARTRFDDTVTRARDSSLTDVQRRDAAREVGSLGGDVLRIARELLGTSDQFGAVFKSVTDTIGSTQTAGLGFEAENRSSRDAAQQSVEALGNILKALEQPDLSLPVLEDQRARLVNIDDASARQIELLDQLIAIETARAAQNEFSVAALQSVQQPLISSTGNPVFDAEVARIIANAVSTAGQQTVDALATGSDINEESLEAVRSDVANLADEIGQLRTLLKQYFESAAA